MTDEPNGDGERTPEPERHGRRSAAEERYRTIFEHSNDAVMLVDLGDERFVDVNPAACDLLGYSRDELLSMRPEDIHPDDIDRVRDEFISEVTEEGAGFTDDMTCLTKAGREIPTEISGAVLSEPDGGPTRMVAMLRDVSARVEHRRELETQVERLDRFAGVVSHDLRNPLSVVQGHVALARETGDPEHLDAIEDAADRMETMLSELLRFTKGGDLVEDRTAVEVETLAREVWSGREADPTTLEVESSTTVRGNRDRLSELLANLFENAREHGGSSTTVRVGAFGDGEGFYVSDDGDGIPPDERDAVFEWGHTTAPDGTGLGLAIVAEIAEAHGWEVGVGDSETGGARIEVRT